MLDNTMARGSSLSNLPSDKSAMGKLGAYATVGSWVDGPSSGVWAIDLPNTGFLGFPCPLLALLKDGSEEALLRDGEEEPEWDKPMSSIWTSLRAAKANSETLRAFSHRAAFSFGGLLSWALEVF